MPVLTVVRWWVYIAAWYRGARAKRSHVWWAHKESIWAVGEDDGVETRIRRVGPCEPSSGTWFVRGQGLARCKTRCLNGNWRCRNRARDCLRSVCHRETIGDPMIGSTVSVIERYSGQFRSWDRPMVCNRRLFASFTTLRYSRIGTPVLVKLRYVPCSNLIRKDNVV